jgi:translocation protein SEC62
MQAQPPPGGMPQPGQMPTPEQIAAMRRQLAIDAEKAGMSVPEFIEQLKRQAQEQQMRAMQQQQQQGGGHQHPHQHPHPHQHQTQQQPIIPGPPKPEALALAKFLRGQDLKTRTCILNGDRKDMFKGTIYSSSILA